MSFASMMFCVILGAAFIYANRKMGADNRIVANWSKTKGVILNTKVVGRDILLVEYEYFIDEVRYQSNNVYRQNSQYGLGTPYDLDKLEFLKNPEVKYDPKNPLDSCLLTYDKMWYRVLFLSLGVILSIIGWIAVIIKIFKWFNP